MTIRSPSVGRWTLKVWQMTDGTRHAIAQMVLCFVLAFLMLGALALIGEWLGVS